MRSSTVLWLFISIIISCNNRTENAPLDLSDDEFLIQRADSFNLGTEYSPPPGDALSHHAAGFAKILCSAVFITGLDFDFSAENIGYFTAPYIQREKFASRVLDVENKEVRVSLPNGVVRTARFFDDQGCICLPEGSDSIYFQPQEIVSELPPAHTQPWPLGDLTIEGDFPKDLDRLKVEGAVNSMFVNPDHLTAAFLVTYKGKIVAEQYRDGINMNTRLESWSMGKSLTATLMGLLIAQGEYSLLQPAPIPEWYVNKDDPRSAIRISDILNMSSGLYCRAPQDPDFDEDLGYPDHLYLYTGTINSFKYAASLPQQFPPGKVGRYRNSDPVLTNYLVRLAVEGRDEDYLNFPQKALFDKLGIRNMVMETDPYGNYLLQGYEFATARDWARLGNLYLNKGIFNGERILGEDFVKFVSTLAQPWLEDNRPIYGGFFWINGDGEIPIPEDAYFMAGAGGQYTFIIPSHDLVVVRLTHYKGGSPGRETFHNALKTIVEAVNSDL